MNFDKSFYQVVDFVGFFFTSPFGSLKGEVHVGEGLSTHRRDDDGSRSDSRPETPDLQQCPLAPLLESGPVPSCLSRTRPFRFRKLLPFYRTRFSTSFLERPHTATPSSPVHSSVYHPWFPRHPCAYRPSPPPDRPLPEFSVQRDQTESSRDQNTARTVSGRSTSNGSWTTHGPPVVHVRSLTENFEVMRCGA